MGYFMYVWFFRVCNKDNNTVNEGLAKVE